MRFITVVIIDISLEYLGKVVLPVSSTVKILLSPFHILFVISKSLYQPMLRSPFNYILYLLCVLTLEYNACKTAPPKSTQSLREDDIRGV